MSSPSHSPDTARRLVALERFYGGLASAPEPSRRVGWESASAHAMRLASIAEAAAPLEGLASVLDAGCGEAALLPVLRARGFRGAYLGEDLREAPLERARAALGPDDAVALRDSFTGEGPEADLVVCSGALNTVSDAGDHDAEVAAALAALWKRTREVLVVDFAVRDRHQEGVGLAAADPLAALATARRLAPVVVLREDVAPGEALLVLARGRARAFSRRGLDVVTTADALVLAGEPAAALSLLEGGAGGAAPSLENRDIDDPARAGRRALIEGQAASQLGDLPRAFAAFERAARLGSPAVATAARLGQAPILWRTGRRAECEALLTGLAAYDDEARAHLAELLRGRGDLAGARAVARRIEDPWIAREVLARLG